MHRRAHHASAGLGTGSAELCTALHLRIPLVFFAVVSAGIAKFKGHRTALTMEFNIRNHHFCRHIASFGTHLHNGDLSPLKVRTFLTETIMKSLETNTVAGKTVFNSVSGITVLHRFTSRHKSS
jgi:hypothetical protein